MAGDKQSFGLASRQVQVCQAIMLGIGLIEVSKNGELLKTFHRFTGEVKVR